MALASQIACRLSHYIDVLRAGGVLTSSSPDTPAGAIDVSFATDDSRMARPGTLFVCKGAAFKREYLLGAIEAGAVAYVSEVDYEVSRDAGRPVPCLLVNDVRRALGLLADAAYDHPSGRVKVCAFTGTKGKTTSAYYLKSVLDAHARLVGGRTAGLFSSIEFDDGENRGTSKLTTPEAFVLEQQLANAAASGMEHVVMEASSQALKYDRTLGVEFAVGAFTNIGEDHISPIEHPTFEDYFASKLKIFAQSRVAVVNLDMDRVDEVLAAAHAAGCERVITYSLSDDAADVFAGGLRHTDRGIVACVRTPRFTEDILVATPVKFNVSNALGAIACAEGLGIEREAIVHGFERLRVPGRMELYPSADGRILGVVDFAHNGMSLETMLRDLRENYPDRELAVVFGATGGKGVDRRETMGAAAGKFADRIVITEDDPGPEDPKDICATIARFVEAEGNTNWRIEMDRTEAIRTAVRETAGRALVIVTGKGHETRMLRRHGAEPCEADGPVLERALAELS